MKTQTLILAFALLFHVTFAQQNQLTNDFDKVLSKQFKSGETGATALVAKNGQVIYRKAFGMANLELSVPMQTGNVFRIASLTKQFTAIAILQLMEQGKLNLQDEITRFIPGYPLQGSRITIENLLTHTSGIRDYTSIKDTVQRMKMDISTKEMVAYFQDQPMRFAPGTKWEYSNSNYFLLGHIIEKITGKTYAQYLDDHFFRPLGMTSSLYANDIKLIPNRAAGYTKGAKEIENASAVSMSQPYAAGAIQSSVDDMFKWQQAVQSYRLVKKETLEKAFTRVKLSDGKETAYGYGWRFGNIQESPSIWHGGLIHGYRSIAIYLPKDDVYVIVLSNCDCNSPQEVAAELAAIAMGRPYSYKEIVLADQVLQEYPGIYENESGEQRVVSLSPGKVYSQRGRSPKLNLKAFQKDKFVFDDPMTTMEFSRNKANKIEKLTIKSRNGNEVWNRSDKALVVQTVIKVDEKILELYVGEYEVTPQFSFEILKESDRLFLLATGQEKVEIFAEANNKFFLKVNDAQLEFVNEAGKITKAILKQGGRTTDAKKIK